MKSLFITGTDTDVGKTYITAGLAVVLRKMDVGYEILNPPLCKRGYLNPRGGGKGGRGRKRVPHTLVCDKRFKIRDLRTLYPNVALINDD